MVDHFSLSSVSWQRLHVGPLAPYVEDYAKRLHKRGYGGVSGRFKLRLVANFSRWLNRRRFLVVDVDAKLIAKYHTYRRRVGKAQKGDLETTRDFLSMLREVGAVAAIPPYVDESPAACIVRDFGQYLSQERGLCQVTITNALIYVRQFLNHRFAARPVRLDKLRPSDVTGFVLHKASTGSPKSAQVIAGKLRSFFRFLRLRGDISLDLAGVVPAVASWRYSTLPRYIGAKDVDILLRSCDQGTQSGRRDYAILLLLARLGLRSGEVGDLTLDDFDWDAGELTLRGKGGRKDRLPIPRDVGIALASYLRKGRPASATRRVFVRLHAPHTDFGRKTVGDVVRRALARADLHPPHKGAHLLRHSLATEMLRKGASLAEIGEILRHNHTSTTAIYAKVDIEALRDLAQPWPGGKR